MLLTITNYIIDNARIMHTDLVSVNFSIVLYIIFRCKKGIRMTLVIENENF